jgi:hypothetical protein
MIEQHVVDLETSKRLAPYLPEGFKSEFYWFGYSEQTLELTPNEDFKISYAYWQEAKESGLLDPPIFYPALLLTEVLEVLPKELIVEGKKYLWSQRHYGIWYQEDGTGIVLSRSSFYSHDLPDAAARLALWLVENGYELEVAK